MPDRVIDLRRFMEIREGQVYYKGYFIPGNPGWLRGMVSKKREDGLIEAKNFRAFVDDTGHVLWQKPGPPKVQSVGDFEQDLRDFTRMVEEAGMLIFLQDYRGERGSAAS